MASLGRRTGRMSLAQLGKAAGGLDYAVVSKTIARFGRRLSLEVALREQVGPYRTVIVQMTRHDPNVF